MCGRYYYDQDTADDIERLTGQRPETEDFAGDVYPSTEGVVLCGRDTLKPEKMCWGFPGFKGSQLIINARAESALEKRMFAESVLNRRCIIPAKWFYEWDKDKNKARFTFDGTPSVYMAGFYDLKDSVKRYVILTTAANESMIRTHDRMPLILSESEIEDWIFDPQRTKDILKQGSPMLSKKQDYEQLSWF